MKTELNCPLYLPILLSLSHIYILLVTVPRVVVCRSSGKQYASEASWSTELPQESSVGVLGVHSGHHRPRHRRFQWVTLLQVFPFMNPLAHRSRCFLCYLWFVCKKRRRSTQSRSKETLMSAVWSFSWRTDLLITVTPCWLMWHPTAWLNNSTSTWRTSIDVDTLLWQSTRHAKALWTFSPPQLPLQMTISLNWESNMEHVRCQECELDLDSCCRCRFTSFRGRTSLSTCLCGERTGFSFSRNPCEGWDPCVDAMTHSGF